LGRGKRDPTHSKKRKKKRPPAPLTSVGATSPPIYCPFPNGGNAGTREGTQGHAEKKTRQKKDNQKLVKSCWWVLEQRTPPKKVSHQRWVKKKERGTLPRQGPNKIPKKTWGGVVWDKKKEDPNRREKSVSPFHKRMGKKGESQALVRVWVFSNRKTK